MKPTLPHAEKPRFNLTSQHRPPKPACRPVRPVCVRSGVLSRERVLCVSHDILEGQTQEIRTARGRVRQPHKGGGEGTEAEIFLGGSGCLLGLQRVGSRIPGDERTPVL